VRYTASNFCRRAGRALPELEALLKCGAMGINSRTHIVMVPGFAGFDALGQLEYYAGVTPTFDAWRRRATDQRVTLHYFDNLPTAGVRVRAKRLRNYLAKRVARGEFQPGDRLALVGHSTGGLDVRQLLLDLRQDRRPDAVDGTHVAGQDLTGRDLTGGHVSGSAVPPGTILDMLHRIVFMSVPQAGTNIADWVSSHRTEREFFIRQLRHLVSAASHSSTLDRLEAWATEKTLAITQADLLRAVQDTLKEVDAPRGLDVERTAGAHEAAAFLELWLRHIDSDFSAIDDLTSAQPKDRKKLSPAHRRASELDDELASFRSHDIETLSFATLGNRPFSFPPGERLAPWKLWSARSLAELEPRSDTAPTDIAYRLAYRACTGGPFECVWPVNALLACVGGEPIDARSIEAWDNDGIVNTASMFWPNGAKTKLVRGDHGDIIGHYRLAPEEPNADSSRRYHSYDLLGSGSGFDAETFQAVWFDTFGFCVR
jgi:triacylglycerol lipase